MFPGSTGGQDSLQGLRLAGYSAEPVWYKDRQLPEVDLIVLPGGHSFGDHPRPGGLAARTPVMEAVRHAADSDVPVLGIGNGFQILTEAELLPGALLLNGGLSFICRTVTVEVASAATPFTARLPTGSRLRLPVAHACGRYYADSETLQQLEDGGRVVFRYSAGHNPDDSTADIAGISNAAGNVVGLMPHPERALEQLLGSADGLPLFRGPLEQEAVL